MLGEEEGNYSYDDDELDSNAGPYYSSGSDEEESGAQALLRQESIPRVTCNWTPKAAQRRIGDQAVDLSSGGSG